MKRLSIITLLLFVCAAGSETFAQRKAVSGAEVTGTFHFSRKGASGGVSNTISIQALGGNKLKIEMLLLYFHKTWWGMNAHDGGWNGEAIIQGDTAVLIPAPEEQMGSGSCKIILKFSKPGTLIVTTENPFDCQTAVNVYADGTYKKTSGAIQKFSEDILGHVEPQARKAVSGAEVTGTFRSYYRGKYKDVFNEILVQALGGNKLKIQMNLVYPYESKAGMMANMGDASGEAIIQGDTAVFIPEYSADSKLCKITLKFSKPGTLIVTTENNTECGFGHNVSADGTYKKTSGVKPKFEAN